MEKKKKINGWLLPPIERIFKTSFGGINFTKLIKDSVNDVTTVLKVEPNKGQDIAWRERWGLTRLSEDEITTLLTRMRLEIYILSFIAIVNLSLALAFMTIWQDFNTRGITSVILAIAVSMMAAAPATVTAWRRYVIVNNRYITFIEWLKQAIV